MPNKQTIAAIKPKEVSEYEKRVKAVTLAIAHSKNCSAKTLYRNAEVILDFFNGKPFKEKSEV